MIIFGINVNREEDFVTWILQLKELNIYDGMKHPYTNQFEIPEGRVYHSRNIDSGFVSAYGINPEMSDYIGTDTMQNVQSYMISQYYLSEYPNYY